MAKHSDGFFNPCAKLKSAQGFLLLNPNQLNNAILSSLFYAYSVPEGPFWMIHSYVPLSISFAHHFNIQSNNSNHLVG